MERGARRWAPLLCPSCAGRPDGPFRNRALWRHGKSQRYDRLVPAWCGARCCPAPDACDGRSAREVVIRATLQKK